jgi:hypothetical protein
MDADDRADNPASLTIEYGCSHPMGTTTLVRARAAGRLVGVTDVDAGRRPAWTALVVAAVLGLVGLLRPFYAAIPGLLSLLVCWLVWRRGRGRALPTPLIVAFIIAGMTLALGAAWFGVALIVSGTAVFTA